MRVAVLGAGAFGTALATQLAGKQHEVVMWVRSADDARHLNETHESRYLVGHTLPASITATHELAAAVAGRPMIVAVTPSHGIRGVLTQAGPLLDPDAIVVNAAKGIEEGTLHTIDRVYAEVLPAAIAKRAAFLSGPTFAKELARGLPSAIVVASHDHAAAETVQRELSSDTLRVYTTEDVTGVELGGALKNVCAIGAGIADGLGFGLNTRAALITRGLSEMARLGQKMGADPLTFSGLAGIGDLVLTCTGDLSRNRQVGLELGRGRALAEILAGMSAVAEGVRTTRAAHALAQREGVDMPITAAIHAVLYEGVSARDAVVKLLRREPKRERG